LLTIACPALGDMGVLNGHLLLAAASVCPAGLPSFDMARFKP
jgi:hypothetical protein